MILAALNEYYERKQDTGELAPPGFQPKEIPFVLLLDQAGTLLQIDDTRSVSGKQKRARTFLVPQAEIRTSTKIAANLLWDTAEYVLGTPNPKKLADSHRKGGQAEAAYRERLAKLRAAFIDTIRDRLPGVADDPGVGAVLAFLARNDLERLMQESEWPEIAEKNPNLTFRLAGDRADVPVCARPAVVDVLRRASNESAADDGVPGFCLVAGEVDRIERLHPAIHGVWGAQTSGASIVSFNLGAFGSYGKSQNFNAPVGQRAAFAYTTALNHLLRKGSPQRMQVGDASTVFWAAGDCNFESEFADLFGGGSKDDPDRGVVAVRNLLAATQNGVYLAEGGNTRFCILGLAPNAARIAVRFWHSGTVAQFALKIAQHFRDIAIARPAYEREHLPLWRLLASTALQGKSENVAPDLAGDSMRAILVGLSYPAALLQAAVRRCRAERTVTYPRAAVIKASLNRLFRQRNTKELDVSLDKTNTDPGYRLGRLFAALERIQADAQPGINATIRDRYYGSASSAPASVFPVLLRLKNHHLSKLDKPAFVVRYEKLLGEIVDGISRFPGQLSLAEQGSFAIGYYHQQQDFFTKKSEPSDASANPKGAN